MLAQIWGCTRDESNHIVHEFFKSHHFAVGVLPMPGKLDKTRVLIPVLHAGGRYFNLECDIHKFEHSSEWHNVMQGLYIVCSA